MPHTVFAMHGLVRKLESIATLTDEERRSIDALPAAKRIVPAGQDIVREGERPHACAMIASGWVCRYRTNGSGARQIFSFHISGDIPDLQSLLLPVMDHSLGALTDADVAFIPHERIRDLARRFPNLGKALWRDTLVDAAIYRAWMMGMGRRSALEQMAHLFCELFARLQAIGLVDRLESGEVPISQTDMADALGMSAVHINRTLRELRARGLVGWANGRLVLKNLEEIQELAEFDPTYLHLIA